MTLRSPLFAPLALLAALCLAPTNRAQDLQETILSTLSAADTTAPEHLFALGRNLLDAAPDSEDTFKNVLLASLGGQSEKARFVAAVALEDLRDDSVFGKDLLELLRPLASSSDDRLRALSMALLGNRKKFNSRVLPDVREILAKNCEDELTPPLVRIEASLSLWNVGNNKERALAKRALEQFLRSTDRELQVRGALALAAINTEGGKAWTILREIRDEPTEFGRQARLFLEREEERREFEHKLGELARRMHGAPAASGEESKYRMLDEIESRIHFMHVRGGEVSDQELLEYAAKGMLSGLDRYSTFFTSEEFQRFFFDLDREYGGIGAFVNFDQEGDFSIVRPIYSGPAYKAGLLSGDKILKVDGWETAGNTSDEIIKHLKGRPGTEVVLEIFRPGFQEPQEVSITRQQIAVPSVNWTMVPGQIGYIELIAFSANISKEIQVALDDLLAKGAKGIVLDVRNNTGGFLGKAVDVCEKFLPPEKLVLYTEGPADPRREYHTRRGRFHTDLPLAVLTNKYTASASEITAGALQDHGRAVIVGKRTYGKGTVQNLIELDSDPAEPFDDLNGDRAWQDGEPYVDRNHNGKYDAGSHIKLTVAKYYLPSGRSPHREYDKDGRIVDPNWGVIPDKELDVIQQKPEDAWKNSAVFALLKKNVFRTYVKEHLPGHEELFRRLAEGDGGDPQRYPDFDAFYESLDTHLGKDDVRRWLRYEVRARISDLRGAVYPGNRALGDPQEDAQLQEAVRTLLGDLGEDIRKIEAYRNVLKIPFDDGVSKGKGR